MREKEEQKVWYSLYGRLLDEKLLRAAFAKVKRARGKPGIDGQTVADFAESKEQEIARLLQELREKSYRPSPVRRVFYTQTGWWNP
jgi:retron-type reverse transcriptase